VRVRPFLGSLETPRDVRQLGRPLEVALPEPGRAAVDLLRRRRGSTSVCGAVRQGSFLSSLCHFRIQTALGPVVGQRARIADGPALDVRAHRHVEVVDVDAVVPVAIEVLDEPHGQPGRRAHDVDALLLLAAEGQGDAALAARGGLERAADGAGREVVDGGRVAAVIGARDDEVDGAAVREEAVEAQLGAAGGRAVVDDHPVVVIPAVAAGPLRGGVPGAVVAEGVRGHVRRPERGSDQMRLADPGAGGGGDGDGDTMAGILEGVHEGADVGGEAPRGRSIIVHHLDWRSVHLPY